MDLFYRHTFNNLVHHDTRERIVVELNWWEMKPQYSPRYILGIPVTGELTLTMLGNKELRSATMLEF